MWEVISDLVAEGTTVLLTTQYLEEADQLAEQIVVIDKGLIIAEGTSDQLKTQVGGDRLEIVVQPGSSLDDAVSALRAVSDGDPVADPDTRRLVAPVSGGSTVLVDAQGVKVDDLALRRPTLDDVFLTLTGHAADSDPEPEPAGRRGRSRGRKES